MGVGHGDGVDVGRVRLSWQTRIKGNYESCRSKFARLTSAFTPKELRLIAQGCPHQRATLGRQTDWSSTLKGLRHACHINDGTPLGYVSLLNCSPRVARSARNRWAVRRNSFGVKTAPFRPKLGVLQQGDPPNFMGTPLQPLHSMGFRLALTSRRVHAPSRRAPSRCQAGLRGRRRGRG